MLPPSKQTIHTDSSVAVAAAAGGAAAAADAAASAAALRPAAAAATSVCDTADVGKGVHALLCQAVDAGICGDAWVHSTGHNAGRLM